MRKKGLTLIELLVVICIVAALGAVILPAISSAREDDGKVRCKNNLLKLWKGYEIYFNDFDGYIPAKSAHGAPPNFTSYGSGLIWFHALPVFDGDSYSLDRRHSMTDSVFHCPSEKVQTDQWRPHYAQNWYYPTSSTEGKKLSHVATPSETFLLLESTSGVANQYFALPGRLIFITEAQGRRHQFGVNLLFFDGSVRFEDAGNFPTSSKAPLWGDPR